MIWGRRRNQWEIFGGTGGIWLNIRCLCAVCTSQRVLEEQLWVHRVVGEYRWRGKRAEGRSPKWCVQYTYQGLSSLVSVDSAPIAAGREWRGRRCASNEIEGTLRGNSQELWYRGQQRQSILQRREIWCHYQDGFGLRVRLTFGSHVSMRKNDKSWATREWVELLGWRRRRYRMARKKCSPWHKLCTMW